MRFFSRFACAAALGLGVGVAQAQSPVVVSSKIDTEGSVLGQLIIQTLEANGVPTENRLQLGGTSIVREAIKAGEIDIYPEYTGNGAFFFDRADEPGWNDAETAYQTVRELDRERNDLIWLQPAQANNTWAMSVRRDLAEAEGLETLDDLAAICKAVAISALPPVPSSSTPNRRCRPSSRRMVSSSTPTSC